MSLKNYSATTLIGGGSGSLDSIDGTNLTDKDSAIVFSADTFYFYTLDDDSAAAESSPDIITPDANAGNKRWILISSLGTSGSITLGNTGLHLLDSNGTHDLIIKPGSDLTADRELTITTGDSARTITLSGNPTLADWFDQAVKSISSPTLAALTLTAALTVANGGTGAQTLTDHGILLGSGTGAITPLGEATNGQLPIGSTGADPVLAGLTGTADQITVTNGAGSITLSIPANLLIPTVLTVPNEGLHILDTNDSHDLILKAGSDLTADRILTLTTGDVATTVTLGGNFTIAGTTTISAFGATVVDDADAATLRTTIGCPTDPAAGTAGLRTLGTGAAQAMAGNATPTPGDTTVAQAKLKTSQGSVYETADWANFVLPGGEYGFYPQIKMSAQAQGWGATIAGYSSLSYTGWTTYRTSIQLRGGGYDIWAQQRYVTASGEVHWIFILRAVRDYQVTPVTGDSYIIKKGTVVSRYQAPDHPCFGNGGKPLLTPHPFGSYDETKHEIIVINPTNAEIEQMELETIVDDETKPDKDLLEVIAENYEIDEDSSPVWPTKKVTVGLPKCVFNKKLNKKILVDYRFLPPGTIITPIKKVIPKPSYIKTKKLRRKHGRL